MLKSKWLENNGQNKIKELIAKHKHCRSHDCLCDDIRRILRRNKITNYDKQSLFIAAVFAVLQANKLDKIDIVKVFKTLIKNKCKIQSPNEMFDYDCVSLNEMFYLRNTINAIEIKNNQIYFNGNKLN